MDLGLLKMQTTTTKFFHCSYPLTAGGQIGKGNSGAVYSTIPEERKPSQGKYGMTESQAESNSQSKQSRVSAGKKLPNITKQDLPSIDGDAKGEIYSALHHTKPQSREKKAEEAVTLTIAYSTPRNPG